MSAISVIIGLIVIIIVILIISGLSWWIWSLRKSNKMSQPVVNAMKAGCSGMTPSGMVNVAGSQIACGGYAGLSSSSGNGGTGNGDGDKDNFCGVYSPYYYSYPNSYWGYSSDLCHRNPYEFY